MNDLLLAASDSGRSGIKTVVNGARDYFHSKLGVRRELNFDRELGHGDMEVEYQNETYYVGDIADESFGGGQMMMTTKAHIGTEIFTLVGLHRTLPHDAPVFLMTTVPIRTLKVDRPKMKERLTGTKTITVNGEKKTFHIVRVEVAAECATVGWQLRKKGMYHIVDPGSRTFNFCTMQNGIWVDKFSGTLDEGLDALDVPLPMYAAKVFSELSRKVSALGEVVVIGGKAEAVAKEFKSFHENTKAHPDALFANATAAYELGVARLEKDRTQVATQK